MSKKRGASTRRAAKRPARATRTAARRGASAKKAAPSGPKLVDLFLGELDREGPLTRRALERVPEGRDDWKPHDKSMPLGRLASLVATMPSWLAMMIERDEFDLSPPKPASSSSSSFARQFKTNKELVQAMEEAVAGARAALLKTTEAHLMKPWRLLVAGNVVAQQPRYAMLRDSLNHLAHHRGQLTVYLRLNEVAVPAIYGPSADDQRF
jgi:uncharacterized damage-inducible protein DinB